MVNADGAGAELYNLVDDPNEAKNLADDESAVAQRLTKLAIDWRKSFP
ncbi:MAG TPA: hypothetical protein VFW87_00580 [Pirellulales bacterium]|nr:hypothetical protein [Pirellulales bacterium]